MLWPRGGRGPQQTKAGFCERLPHACVRNVGTFLFAFAVVLAPVIAVAAPAQFFVSKIAMLLVGWEIDELWERMESETYAAADEDRYFDTLMQDVWSRHRATQELRRSCSHTSSA